MFAIGLAAGVVGTYVFTRRSQISRLARRALVMGDELLGEFGGVEVSEPVAVASDRSNHGRKTAVEVT